MTIQKTLLTAALTTVAFGASAGPSAKFAATYGDDGPYLESVAVIEDATVDTVVLDESMGFTLATMKVPQQQELLIGVSAEIGLVTDTSIKGKNGGSAKAIAGAGAQAWIFACPVDGSGCTGLAQPGAVTLAQRVQEMNATLGGVIESCLDGSADGIIDGEIQISTECVVTDEEIGLALDTLGSHHFNFVLPNMDAGEYDIKVFFMTGASAAVDIDEVSVTEGGIVSGSANAHALIGKYMVTVQQVRAVKGGIIDADIIAQ